MMKANGKTRLRRILTSNNYQVDTAGSMAAAVELLDANMYHLAVIDIRLVDWDANNAEGMTVLDELRRRHNTDALAKIMISAYGTREQMRHAFREHDVADFILKQEFNKHDFLASVQDAFDKVVRSNLKLDIILEDDLTFENMVVDTITRDGRRVRKTDADLSRLVLELEDLFRRLFFQHERIVVRRVSSGHGKAGVVKVAPFSHDGHDETVIVKYGDYAEINREAGNYENFVKGKIGMRATNILNLRETPRLGGIVYSLIGTHVDQIVDFAAFYLTRPFAEVNRILNDLFKETCANWYADRGNVQHCNLAAAYEQSLDFGLDQLVAAYEANFPFYLNQSTLTFRDLPDEVRPPNPAYAVKGPLSRSTYLCFTHGDLNANNILIDADDHTWLIDFYRTGKGHILRDCVQLETVVKYILLPVAMRTEDELSARYNLERALLNLTRFKQVDALRYDAPSEAYQKAFEVCCKLRQIARDLVHPHDDFSEYEIGLLYCSMNTQRFYKQPKVNRLHALLAAGLLCEKLGLKA